MNDPRNCTYLSEAKAHGVAARCQGDDEDGWTYTARPIVANDFTPAGRPAARWFYVEVRDETGAVLGNL